MTTHTLKNYKQVESALCNKDLMQALYDAGKEVLMGNTLVTLHGKEHQERRLIEMRIFKRDFFKYFERELLPGIVEETLAPFLEEGELNIVEFGYRVMIHLAIAFAGIDRQTKTKEETETFLELIRNFGKAPTLGQLKGDPEPVRKEILKYVDLFNEQFFTPSLERRQKLVEQFNAGEVSEDELPRDILTTLLLNQERLPLDRDCVMRETAFYYLAGAHTSVHSLGHVVHHLLEWCKKHPEDRAKLEADTGMVQRFVYESLRLHPSSPIAKRRAIASTTLNENEIAAENDIVVVDLRNANRDTEIFGEDAAEFNPYRTLPKNIPSHGISFGAGMHSCLGRNLAAGVIPRETEKVALEDRHYGTLATIAQKLLREGIQFHPSDEPKLNQQIERETWEYYPVIIK